MLRVLIRTACLLLLAGLLLSCSRFDLAYRNLDRLTLWWLDGYLDLNSDQKTWLMPRLRSDLAWHCHSELPRYARWIDEQQALAAQPQVTPGQIEAQFDDVDRAMKDIARQITPNSVELLRGLNDEQVAHLATRFEEDLRKWRKEYLAPPPEQQISHRGEQMEKRLRPWFGSLNAPQQQRLQRWASETNSRTPIWLENRRQQQLRLLANLRERHQADFGPRIAAELQEPERLWSAEYRRTYAEGRQALAGLLADLFNSADAEQRTRLAERFGELREDFRSIDCDG